MLKPSMCDQRCNARRFYTLRAEAQILNPVIFDSHQGFSTTRTVLSSNDIK
jgi:hypothetical protein